MFSKTLLYIFTYSLLLCVVVQAIDGSQKRRSESSDRVEYENEEFVEEKPPKQKISLMANFEEEPDEFSGNNHNRERIEGKVMKYPNRNRESKEDSRPTLTLTKPKRIKPKNPELNPPQKLVPETLEEPNFNSELDPQTDDFHFDGVDNQEFNKIRNIICANDFTKSRRFTGDTTSPRKTRFKRVTLFTIPDDVFYPADSFQRSQDLSPKALLETNEHFTESTKKFLIMLQALAMDDDELLNGCACQSYGLAVLMVLIPIFY